MVKCNEAVGWWRGGEHSRDVDMLNDMSLMNRYFQNMHRSLHVYAWYGMIGNNHLVISHSSQSCHSLITVVFVVMIVYIIRAIINF